MAKISYIGGPHNKKRYLSLIENCASEAESVIGLIAYWTVGPDIIPNLVKLNEGPNSFICVDPSSPTDLSLLLSLNELGNNFYAYKYEASGYETKEGLLHIKVLVFDNPDDSAIIILGSHNISVRALTGVNIEHSICLHIKKNEKFYLDLKAQIIEIRDKYCSKIQSVDDVDGGGGGDGGSGDEYFVLKLVGDDMGTLMHEQIISLFYKAPSEAIKTTGQKLLVLAIEADSGEEYLYMTEIMQSGSFDNYIEKSTQIEFSKRRYAEKDLNMIPFLFSEREIPTTTNKKHKYFNTIRFIEKIEKYDLYNYTIVDLTDEIANLYGDEDYNTRAKVKASPRINNQRTISKYKINFNPSKVKEYYNSEIKDMFSGQVRTPNFKEYPKQKRIKEKMFFKRK